MGTALRVAAITTVIVFAAIAGLFVFVLLGPCLGPPVVALMALVAALCWPRKGYSVYVIECDYEYRDGVTRLVGRKVRPVRAPAQDYNDRYPEIRVRRGPPTSEP